MLTPMKDILVAARAGGYAVPAFNYYHQSSAEAIVEEAEAQGSPVILMISGVYLKALSMEMTAALGKYAASKVKVPVALHLDHGPSYEMAEACINAGFTSVMFDGSHGYSYDENVEITSRVVKLAHSKGVSVEAELGAVGGVEDAVYGEDSTRALELIDPKQAADFVAKTGIDCLAPGIGNVHGMTKQEPRIDLERLSAVREAVSLPLALHGGSGISDDTVRELIRRGINKVNVGTELKIAWQKGLSEYFATGAYEPRLAAEAAKASIRKTVASKINLTGSAGKC